MGHFSHSDGLSTVKVSMSAVQDDSDRGVLIQENNDPLDSITSMAEPSGPPFGIVLNGHSLVSQSCGRGAVRTTYLNDWHAVTQPWVQDCLYEYGATKPTSLNMKYFVLSTLCQLQRISSVNYTFMLVTLYQLYCQQLVKHKSMC